MMRLQEYERHEEWLRVNRHYIVSGFRKDCYINFGIQIRRCQRNTYEYAPILRRTMIGTLLPLQLPVP